MIPNESRNCLEEKCFCNVLALMLSTEIWLMISLITFGTMSQLSVCVWGEI